MCRRDAATRRSFGPFPSFGPKRNRRPVIAKVALPPQSLCRSATFKRLALGDESGGDDHRAHRELAAVRGNHALRKVTQLHEKLVFERSSSLVSVVVAWSLAFSVMHSSSGSTDGWSCIFPRDGIELRQRSIEEFSLRCQSLAFVGERLHSLVERCDGSPGFRGSATLFGLANSARTLDVEPAIALSQRSCFEFTSMMFTTTWWRSIILALSLSLAAKSLSVAMFRQMSHAIGRSAGIVCSPPISLFER